MSALLTITQCEVFLKRDISRLTSHLDSNTLLLKYQCNSIILLQLHNELTLAVDKGEVGMLVLLDLSLVFDMVDHWLMLNILTT